MLEDSETTDVDKMVELDDAMEIFLGKWNAMTEQVDAVRLQVALSVCAPRASAK